MKPFDLERAQAGDPLATRDGRAAKFIAHAPEAEKFKVIAIASNEDQVTTYTATGFEYGETEPSRRDLFMYPQKKTVYVNLYHQGCCWWFDDAEKAKSSAIGTSGSFAVAIPIEIED